MHSGEVSCVALSSTRMIATAGRDGSIHVYKDFDRVKTIHSTDRVPVTALDFTSSGDIVFGTNNGQVQFYKVSADRLTLVYEKQYCPVLAICSYDKTIAVSTSREFLLFTDKGKTL